VAIPAGLPPIVTRCRIERDGRPEVALRQLSRPRARRPTERPDVLDYILRARAAINKPPSRGRNAAVIRLCEHALALDPGSAEAKSVLAGNLASGVMDNMTDTAAADIKRAEYLAWQALDAAPRSPTAHWAKG
jgi:hypothetical protein